GIYKWIGIEPSDEPFFTSSPALEVIEFETYTYNIVSEDPNELTLTLSAPVKPEWLVLTDNGDGTGTLSGTAPEIAGETEDFAVTLNVSNGDFEADQEFVITVLTSNQAPEFTSENPTTHVQNTPFEYIVTAADPDEDDLVITAPTLPTWASFVDNGDGTAVVSGTPETTSFLGFQIILVVTDGMFEDTQNFRLQVTANSIEDFGYGSINIYPNPTSGLIYLKNCQNSKYEVLDIVGRVIFEGNIVSSDSYIDIKDFAEGNFFVRLYNEDKVLTVKIVKL
ncbi:MAG: T9SS type A sorting domain-containing protein, partial [Bacteroidales bacterium]|nr:T9SS type A sorting domain-containing protein [Bacteroidales bacterium]